MTDSKNKKGWMKVFRNQNGLYSTLRSVYEGIELFGTGGGGLRGLYADFLEEASPILGSDNLIEAANSYRELAQKWSVFAAVVLPESIPALGETRRLLNKKYKIFNHKGGEGISELGSISRELMTLEVESNTHLGLSEKELHDLFSTMQEHLYAIYEAEKKALAILSSAAS
jgi:hypothetical protein